MSLIKCTMCEKDISPNAVSCPHCGEPMKKSSQPSINTKYKVILKGNLTEKIRLIKEIRQIKGLSLKEAKELVDTVPKDVIVCDTLMDAQKVVNILKNADSQADIDIVECSQNEKSYSVGNITKTVSELSDVIKCPNCSSIKTSKISTTGRVASGLTFGLFSSSIGKTWKCNKCGYKW